MATVTAALQRDLFGQEEVRAYNARLLRVLGDGREWEYTGICNDLGRASGSCSCGHPIRFEYILRHKVRGTGAVVGSECVNHFAEANPDTFRQLTEAVERTRAELAEKERQARAAEQDARNAPLRAEWEACRAVLSAVFASYRERRAYIPEALYYLHAPSEAPDYQRAADYGRWYADQTRRLRRALTEAGHGYGLPAEAEVPEVVKTYKGRTFRQGRDGNWRSAGLERRVYVRWTREEGEVYTWTDALDSWAEVQRAVKGVAEGSEHYRQAGRC